MASPISFLVLLTLAIYHTGIATAGIAREEVNDVCDARIVGGCEVKPGEIKYQLSLRSGGRHFCGGALISTQLVLTAAHCVKGAEPSELTVVAGERRLSTSEGTEQSRQVQKIVMHEKFGMEQFANDIALLKLSSPFKVDNKTVGIVPLPRANYNASSDIIVTGWGGTREGGGLSDILRKVQLSIISDQQCRKDYPQYTIADSMICAGYPEGEKDSCQGDSGGPLVSIKDGFLVGLVSWGEGCARPNKPGVNTEVAKFASWIKEKSASLLAE